MRKSKILIAASLALTSFAATADATMRPGLWEMRMIKQVMDGQDMAAQMAAAQAQMKQMMAQMSPAQRKQMEQAMGQQASASPGTMRICVSPEMAARDKPMMPSDANCEPSKVQKSGNKVSFEINCKNAGQTIVGRGESVSSGDTITTRSDMTMTDASGRHTMQSESQMKYLGSDCQGIKPADQMAREMQGGRRK